MSLKKNLLKNGIANVIQKLIRVAEQLFLVPFFIMAWGAAYYGEWLTLTIIPSVLGFSDFGFGTAAANSFVLRYASGDRQGAANIAKAGRRIITWVILFALSVSLSVMYGMKELGIFDKSLISAHDSIIAVSCMIAAKLFNFYQQLYDALYRAVRKADISRHLLNVYGLMIIIVGIIILKSGGNIVSFAVGNLILSIVFNPIYMYISRRFIDIPEFKSAVINRQDIRDTFKIGMGFMLAPAWQSILFQGSTFVVRLVLGPTAVTIYNTVRTLSRSVNQIFSVIIASVMPEFQYEYASGNTKTAQRIFLTSFFLTLSLATLGVAFLWIFGLDFYQMWTNKSLIVPVYMWLFFIAGIAFNALWLTCEVVFFSFNKPYKINIIALILSLLSIITSYFFSKIYGLNGASLGYFLFDFLMAIYVLPTSFIMIKLNVKQCLDYLKDFNFLDFIKKTLSKFRT